VQAGNLLFVSGQIGSDSTGKLVPGGIGPETRQALENIKAILERNGSGMDHVVKCTAFLADIAEWPAMNQVYRTMFPANAKPARSAFAAGGLVFGARIELECIAAMR
jgi:2-iminobutanoate/2-iminopropanoate deaminase